MAAESIHGLHPRIPESFSIPASSESPVPNWSAHAAPQFCMFNLTGPKIRQGFPHRTIRERELSWWLHSLNTWAVLWLPNISTGRVIQDIQHSTVSTICLFIWDLLLCHHILCVFCPLLIERGRRGCFAIQRKSHIPQLKHINITQNDSPLLGLLPTPHITYYLSISQQFSKFTSELGRQKYHQRAGTEVLTGWFKDAWQNAAELQVSRVTAPWGHSPAIMWQQLNNDISNGVRIPAGFFYPLYMKAAFSLCYSAIVVMPNNNSLFWEVWQKGSKQHCSSLKTINLNSIFSSQYHSAVVSLRLQTLWSWTRQYFLSYSACCGHQ